MCDQGLYSQCETTQNHEHGTGASFFGYSKLYGQVPGGQAEYLRVPFADFLPVKVPHEHADDRFLFLSDVLPTAWQGLQYADVPDGGTLLVLGAGPIGDMAARMGVRAGHRVISVDRVPERLARVEAFGAEPLNLDDAEDVGSVGDVVREATGGRGPDAVIDAVGMEAHGSPFGKIAQTMAAALPGRVAESLMKRAGTDRLAALNLAFELVRRGGTVSIVGVYGGMTDPMPMLRLFDKQIELRMGQANVRRWVDDILPLLIDADPLGVDDFASHRLPLSAAPMAYENFQAKKDDTFKVLFQPALAG